MFKKIRGFFASLKNKFKSLFISKSDSKAIIMPMSGDILELPDGSRRVIAYSGFDENDYLDLRFFLEPKIVINKKGRSIFVQTISSSSERWPPKNGSYLYRDGNVIYPESNWKINFVKRINDLVLK